jgi:hypothetical protein
VRPVGVHLDDDLGAAGEGDAEPVEVRPAEALLRGPVADADPGVNAGEVIAMRPVPSGEPSSTTSSVAPGSASRIAAAMPVMFSASLYVGSTTQAPVPRGGRAAGSGAVRRRGLVMAGPV